MVSPHTSIKCSSVTDPKSEKYILKKNRKKNQTRKSSPIPQHIHTNTHISQSHRLFSHVLPLNTSFKKTVLHLPPHLAFITSQISWVGYSLDPLPILKVYRTQVKFMATPACTSSCPVLHSSLVLELCGVGIVLVPSCIRSLTQEFCSWSCLWRACD